MKMPRIKLPTLSKFDVVILLVGISFGFGSAYVGNINNSESSKVSNIEEKIAETQEIDNAQEQAQSLLKQEKQEEDKQEKIQKTKKEEPAKSVASNHELEIVVPTATTAAKPKTTQDSKPSSKVSTKPKKEEQKCDWVIVEQEAYGGYNNLMVYYSKIPIKAQLGGRQVSPGGYPYDFGVVSLEYDLLYFFKRDFADPCGVKEYSIESANLISPNDAGVVVLDKKNGKLTFTRNPKFFGKFVYIGYTLKYKDSDGAGYKTHKGGFDMDFDTNRSYSASMGLYEIHDEMSGKRKLIKLNPEDHPEYIEAINAAIEEGKIDLNK